MPAPALAHPARLRLRARRPDGPSAPSDPFGSSRSSGIMVAQVSFAFAYGQRGAKRQAGGGLFRSGGRPGIAVSRPVRIPSPSIWGKAPSNASVYGCSGRSKRSFTDACSTICPPYMTTMSSADSATTPMSCVIRIIAISWAWRRSSRRSSTAACTVTSSAVVGSSAITSLGSQESAIAIITRCLIPPENRWG